MSLRLGFCGVGRWASKLATAFRACGAEIVAHDRSSPVAKRESYPDSPDPRLLHGFGVRTPWRSQLADKSIDAIVAVAPPEITTEVALACAAAGKPVMATKPLFDHPETIRAPFYVDFWRLWADEHDWTKTATGGGSHVRYILRGSGPFRDFPGSLDYGPHVMAALFSQPEPAMLVEATRKPCASGELFSCVYILGKSVWNVEFGNGATDSLRQIGDAVETPLAIGGQPKEQILKRFCQSFLNDISEGFVDTRLLELSRRGMEELRKIREMACPT